MENRTKISLFALVGRYEQIFNDVVIMGNSDLHSRSKWGEAYDHLVMDHIEWKYYIRKVEALNFSINTLKKSGSFISKIFMGSSFNEIVASCKKKFEEVHIFKPLASRKSSKENFIICKKFR